MQALKSSAYGVSEKRLQVWSVYANEEQLKQCKPHPNITFEKGCAEKIGLPSSSLDLVTVATALHWCVHMQPGASDDFCLSQCAQSAADVFDKGHESVVIASGKVCKGAAALSMTE